jgi:hypothetical protein
VKFRIKLHDSVSNEPAMFPAPDDLFYNYQLEIIGAGMKCNLMQWISQQSSQNLWPHTQTVIKYLYLRITAFVVMTVDIHVGLHTHMNLDVKTLTKESSHNLTVNPLVKTKLVL